MEGNWPALRFLMKSGYKISEDRARIYSNTIPIISGITLAAGFDTSIAKMGGKKRELNTVNYL